MKRIKILLSLFLAISFTILFISCGSKDRDKTLKYIKELNEYVKSMEFRNLTFNLLNTAIVKSATGETNFDNAKFSLEFNNVLGKKKEEIAKKYGFKDSKEAESTLDKLKDEKDIKEIYEQFNSAIKKLQDELEKEGGRKVEEMKQNTDNINNETGEVNDDGTFREDKTKPKESQKEPPKNKVETKETPPVKKEAKENNQEKTNKNNIKTEHPEDNLP